MHNLEILTLPSSTGHRSRCLLMSTGHDKESAMEKRRRKRHGSLSTNGQSGPIVSLLWYSKIKDSMKMQHALLIVPRFSSGRCFGNNEALGNGSFHSS